MIEKKEKFEKYYPKEEPTPEQLEKKQMLQDIESMTARVILMSTPTSNVHRDATRIRNRYGMSPVIR